MSLEDAVDLGVDENFDFYINHRGEGATVSGRAAFEQRLAYALTDDTQEIIGEFNDANAIGEVRKIISRITTEEEMIERVATFDASFSDEQEGLLDIVLVYDTGDEFTFEVEA